MHPGAPERDGNHNRAEESSVHSFEEAPSRLERPINSSLEEILERSPTIELTAANNDGARYSSNIASCNAILSNTCAPAATHTETIYDSQSLQPDQIPLPDFGSGSSLYTGISGSYRYTRSNGGNNNIPEQDPVLENIQTYNENIARLAETVSYLRLIASSECRCMLSGKIIIYDFSATYEVLHREELCNLNSRPNTSEFVSRIKTPSQGTRQRLILVEDLSPLFISAIGSTFGIVPDFFVDHLDQSGYSKDPINQNMPVMWQIGGIEKRHKSITWYRPVLPLLSVSSQFRAKVLKGESVKVKCIFPDCNKLNDPGEANKQHHSAETTENIWRRNLSLSSEPGFHTKGSQSEYPIAWEERATIWTKEIDGCEFVILLLDPLPLLVDRLGTNKNAHAPFGAAQRVEPSPDNVYSPFQQIKSRFAASRFENDIFTTELVDNIVDSLRESISTIDDIDSWIQRLSEEDTHQDPLYPLFRSIYSDTMSLLDIIRLSLVRIRQGSLNEDLMQKRVSYWRLLLHQFQSSLTEINHELGAFFRLTRRIENSQFKNAQLDIPFNSEGLVDEANIRIHDTIQLVDNISSSLRSEMQILDSKRSIAEAESVSKITELAFIFIPLSFTASLFSMQIKELNEAVSVYYFIIVSLLFLLLAYFIRLMVRSTWIITYKRRCFDTIRNRASLQSHDPIPTRMFLRWIFPYLGNELLQTVNAVASAIVLPALFCVALGVLFSPVIVLWIRNINQGFSIAITVLSFFLNVILVLPVIDAISESQNYNWNLKEWRDQFQSGKKQTVIEIEYEQSYDPSLEEGQGIESHIEPRIR